MNYPTIQQFSLYEDNSIIATNTSYVTYNQKININGIVLNIECKADFSTIPKDHHQMFLQVLQNEAKIINVK